MTPSQTIAAKRLPLQPKLRTAGFDRTALFTIVVLCMLTISSAAVLVGSVPRISIVMPIIAIYMLFRLGGEIRLRYIQFGLLYLAAFIPGTLNAIGDVKLVSVVQVIVALGASAIVASYYQAWLAREPDKAKQRGLEVVILIFLLFSIFEMNFYELVTKARQWFYHTQFTDIIGSIYMRRELILYGGRPTGFFSETSNFARFLSLITATYMTVTRCSWRSLAVLVLFLFLVRSVSFFYAAPAMGLALIQSPPQIGLRTRQLARGLRSNLWLVLGILGLIGAVVAATQADRIEGALQSSDGSFNARIVFPLNYLLYESQSPFVGMGMTPQDSVQEFTREQQVIQERMALVAGFNEGISGTIVMLVGCGLLGLAIFLFGSVWMAGSEGLLLAASFLYCNLLNSGYNSPTMFTPFAVLMGLLLYQRQRSASVKDK